MHKKIQDIVDNYDGLLVLSQNVRSYTQKPVIMLCITIIYLIKTTNEVKSISAGMTIDKV
jgi:hypothetical protein